MPVDHIRYDLLAQDALRGVVRKVLVDAAKKGLPGEHHFFITFDTRADGVRLSERMRAQYPEEMTVVLQHQFWDLKVSDATFEVGLSFGGVAERLVVPFEAIKAFVDPSIQFGLQFETATEEQASGSPSPSPAKTETPEKKTERSKSKPRPPARHDAPASAPPSPLPANPPAGSDDSPPEKSGAEVVRLDRFRKK
jgi:hypothetical protein